MMFHFPYFSMPYNNRYSRYGYRYPYYSYGSINNNKNYNSTNFEHKSSSKFVHNKKNSTFKNISSNINNCIENKCDNSFINTKESAKSNNCSSSNTDTPLFQLFGIDLYFDDILLICLIWFLYDEGVKDEGLFMALILLLLS